HVLPGALENIGEHGILTLPNVAFRPGVSNARGFRTKGQRRRVACDKASMFSCIRPDIALRYSQPSAFARRHELHHCSVNDVSAVGGRRGAMSAVGGRSGGEGAAPCFADGRCFVDEGWLLEDRRRGGMSMREDMNGPP